MKYLNRNKIYHKIEPFKNAKKLYLFCEGDKEVNYFRYFQGFASNIDIIPIPNDNGKSDPVKLKENSELLFFGSEAVNSKLTLSEELQDEIWFVIDTDRWNEGDKINILKAYLAERNKDYKGWFVVQSNPCFELWLFYHFHSERPRSDEVSGYSSFKEYVNSKIIGGFDNRSMPLEIQKAALASKENFEILNGQPTLYSTEVFYLAKQIIRFTKSQLDYCLENLKIR
ncbi:RloB-like protein [Chryseobacterium taeanense]|uniref:RloB-like protein n=1 Tax=Chryseobacterium taeanense TaxID=311334 RepID=A0A1G8I466_9FLAO|nr:RloB family protein [Chryseobacterium taeanense]SDI13647.1 RloB-like protein [Chryseobacterium taeanense]